MKTIIVSDEELFYIEKAVLLFDVEMSKRKSYTPKDREFNRQLVIKLISIEDEKVFEKSVTT